MKDWKGLFTYGSKMYVGTGADVYIEEGNKRKSYSIQKF